jgi:hypothetical protein
MIPSSRSIRAAFRDHPLSPPVPASTSSSV